MYENFFNFSGKPFDLLPNPEMLFLSQSHGKALTYLRHGIEERMGFILLTGEIGAGKTTLIRELIKRHFDTVLVAKVFNTRVDSHQLMVLINDDFGLVTEGRDKATLIRELNEFLIDSYAAGQRAVLIIDEAQNLTPELLEEVRLLSNLETDEGKLLQIILAGQPELRETLKCPELLQLRQRIQISYHLSSLNLEEIESYIYYRMECAGNRNAVKFAKDALETIASLTRGIPRLVNILCDYLLMDACASERYDIAQSDVVEIAEELGFEELYWQSSSSHPLSKVLPPKELDIQMKEDVHMEEAIHMATDAQTESLTPEGSRTLMSRLDLLENRLEFLEKECARSTQSTLASLLDKIEAVEKMVHSSPNKKADSTAITWHEVAQEDAGVSSCDEERGKSRLKRSWLRRFLDRG